MTVDSLTLQPLDMWGTDTFVYTITTTNGKTATATATITVNAANPTATADTYAASENTGLTINQASGLLSNDVAPAGEALSLSLPSTTAHGGTLTADTNNDGGFTYTPATGFAGTDTFTYTITTTHGKTSNSHCNLKRCCSHTKLRMLIPIPQQKMLL